MTGTEEGFIFDFNVVNLMLKNNGGRDRRPNFVVFVVWSAFNVDGWVGGGVEILV